MASDSANLDVSQWLKTLPLAPEYHPTPAEFQDPIAYILKIEKEASCYGICKIVPPLPAPSRKTAVSNLNKSFAAWNGAGPHSKKSAPTFTTRQQQIGFCPRKPRPVQKPVWQSGEEYTLQQFEVKAKQFERTQLRNCGRKGANAGFSPLEVESLFWKASADKPFMVEYANDMPGSGFNPIPLSEGVKKWREEDVGNVGDTAWNMRGVSRAKGSLLKFMKEEIPGVTSPMIYVAMMFSWFAWHVEDHELHSLNYMHIGAGKTWYGVPRDAGLAFEEVVRDHGYGGEVNPLVTFALLGEKTTVMSPEVLVEAGVPCCRLVQNAGDFVITFPGSYHCGFSHGFNCGEAANIATPQWLKVAKEAAARRASINYPPMVSHYQLLYELALSMWSSSPLSGVAEPRSSRLKYKMKGEGELMIKEQFVENIIENNNLLHILIGKGSSCVVMPRNTLDTTFNSNLHMKSQVKAKPRLSLGLCSHEEALEASKGLPSCHQKNFHLTRYENTENSGPHMSNSNSGNMNSEKGSTLQGEGLLDQGLLSCVTCGILSFACVAVVQPTNAAAVRLMSADCSSFNNQSVDFGTISGMGNGVGSMPKNYELESAGKKRVNFDGIADSFKYSSDYQVEISEHDPPSSSVTEKGPSALDLLACAYVDSSDSEYEEPWPKITRINDEIDFGNSPLGSKPIQNSEQSGDVFVSQDICANECEDRIDGQSKPPGFASDLSFSSLSHSRWAGDASETTNCTIKNRCQSKRKFSSSILEDNEVTKGVKSDNANEMDTLSRSKRHASLSKGTNFEKLNNSTLISDRAEVLQRDRKIEQPLSEDLSFASDSYKNLGQSPSQLAAASTKPYKLETAWDSVAPFTHRPDKDSSRMHVFCLEHALEVEKQLRPLGGVRVMVICHPEYPKLESEAISVAEELGIDYVWKDIDFKEATEEDQERIQSALEDEEAIPTNSDWAVKMHVNLYYSANLSKSPLYSKQLPHNAIIYKAFGRSPSGGSPGKFKVFHRRRGRQKKINVAGKWCGKVWMTNQVHPYLAHRNDAEEQEHLEVFQHEDAEETILEIENNHVTRTRSLAKNSFANCSTPIKTSTRKREKSTNKSTVKKPRRDVQYETPDDSSDDFSAQPERVSRGQAKRAPTPPSRDRVRKTKCSKPSLNDDSDGGPSTRLRRRPAKPESVKMKKPAAEKQVKKKGKEPAVKNSAAKGDGGEYLCDIEGCNMSFVTKQDLALHKRNICPVKGCGKKFFCHKYLVQHRRVHMDERPLKCPWKGCKMSFKWAWARTEHIRVHTGDRPYICMERGCGQTFRFVSDFSRHKRKTGHVSRKGLR